MVQIIRANQRPESFGSAVGRSLGGGFSQGVAERLQGMEKGKSIESERKHEFEKLKYQAEQDELSQARRFAHETELAGVKNEAKEEQTQQKVAGLQGALGRVDEMLKIRKKGNLGRMAHFTGIFGGEPGKDIGSYTTLGNSLISFMSTIPVRNQKEFDKLSGRLTDPYITDEEAEGVLTEMKHIITDSLNQYNGSGSKQSASKKPSLQSFER